MLVMELISSLSGMFSPACGMMLHIDAWLVLCVRSDRCMTCALQCLVLCIRSYRCMSSSLGHIDACLPH